jgi:hypothetical protein
MGRRCPICGRRNRRETSGRRGWRARAAIWSEGFPQIQEAADCRSRSQWRGEPGVGRRPSAGNGASARRGAKGSIGFGAWRAAEVLRLRQNGRKQAEKTKFVLPHTEHGAMRVEIGGADTRHGATRTRHRGADTRGDQIRTPCGEPVPRRDAPHTCRSAVGTRRDTTRTSRSRSRTADDHARHSRIAGGTRRNPARARGGVAPTCGGSVATRREPTDTDRHLTSNDRRRVETPGGVRRMRARRSDTQATTPRSRATRPRHAIRRGRARNNAKKPLRFAGRVNAGNYRDPRSAIRDPRSAIRDPRSAIRDPRSAIRDPRSAHAHAERRSCEIPTELGSARVMGVRRRRCIPRMIARDISDHLIIS